MFTVSFFLVAGFAVFLVGIIKSGFLGGNALLGVVLLSVFMSPIAAIGIFLPLLILMDLMNVWHYRKSWSKKFYWQLMPAAIFGVAAGAILFQYINENMLRLVIGGFAIYTVVRYLLPIKHKINAGYLMGFLGGLSSFIAHAGAPPIDSYLLNQKLKKTNAMATSVYIFATINIGKLAPYYWLDLLAPQNLQASLFLLPFVPLGVFAGQFLHKIVSQKLFENITYIMLTIIGIKLIYDGITLWQ